MSDRSRLDANDPFIRGRFSNNTAVVTGGANGIGRACVVRMVAEGASVVVIDREPADGEAAQMLLADVVDSKAVAYCQADVTDAGQVKKAVEHGASALGPVDILINNAGYGLNHKPIEAIPASEWQELLTVNITSTFTVTAAVLPGMRQRGYGRVVNMSSNAGRGTSPAQHIGYATSKAGLMGFTRKLAYEEARNGITVNAVAPGTIFTERVRKKFEAGTPEQKKSMDAIPLGRPGTPEEVAAVVLFLASRDASYVTGVVWDVNGGKLMA